MNKINIHGFCIDLEEIESVLRNHPAIAEAAVTPDKGITERLVAWGVCKPKTDVDVPEIRRYVEKFLPVHMVPSIFIFMKQLPLNADGKTDRAALSFDAAEHSQSDGIPRSQIESIVADIWKTTLGEEQIGTTDDFLDIGGDSIQAGLISLKILEYFKVEISLAMFFKDMTVRLLSDLIEDQIKNNVFAQSDRITPIDRNDDMPLSLFQESRLRYELSRDTLNVPYLHSSSWFSIWLSGSLNRDALEKAFNYVINRHEVFRTAYCPVLDSISPETNKWEMIRRACSINPGLFLPKVKIKQSIHSSVSMNFDYYDISEYSDADKHIEMIVITSEIIQKRYDYETPPLTRAALIRVAEANYVLIVAAAHLIADGVSMQIYEKELASVYSALVNKQSVKLPACEIQYADYAAWMQHRLETGSLDSMKSYWQKQFEGYTPTNVTILPFTDIEGSKNDADFGIEAKYYYHPLSDKLDEKIRKYAGSVNMTVFSIVMTGFILYLHEESGKDDIGVYTFFANRTRPETENIIGMFATGNTIRVKINADDSLSQCVADVSESLNGALKNQELVVNPAGSRTIKSLYDLVVSHPITCELLTDTGCASFSGLDVEKAISGRSKSEYALRSFVIDSGKKLSLMFQYNLDLFDGADIRRMAAHTEDIITEIITNPSKSISLAV